eukprot:NODE_7618_length_557_cov_34.153543_g6590_i0.p2 GENE.NODE_7618_length_557_cov_34.153543_g6590_i0~~NODE_7618_length_557_cov_34.153543_g6590_i0.p2  ORF type:complete len:138 (+),score=38.10 NODE_7618_length_557_cov_34.153543_g6590_i0:83-496(+)
MAAMFAFVCAILLSGLLATEIDVGAPKGKAPSPAEAPVPVPKAGAPVPMPKTVVPPVPRAVAPVPTSPAPEQLPFPAVSPLHGAPVATVIIKPKKGPPHFVGLLIGIAGMVVAGLGLAAFAVFMLRSRQEEGHMQIN